MDMITSFRGRHAFLSNFCPARFWYTGIAWPSAEHAFQAMKNPDPDARPAFASITRPADAKRAGRRQPMRHDWEGIKRKIMLEIVLAKFSQNGGLRWQLAQTAPAMLIEGNTWSDTYWGMVPAASHSPENTWDGTRELHGENWLGRILMMAREVLS